MTSGKFQSVLIDQITIAERQRADLGDISNLAQSLSTDGLLNPIVITPDYALVAGERRLTAAKHLGWSHILAHFTTDLPASTLHKLELEENVRRRDLEWKERCYAVEKYHALMSESDPEWTQARTAEALNVSAMHITQNLAVARALHNGVELVCNADKFSVARGIVERSAERARANQLDALPAAIGGGPDPSLRATQGLGLPDKEGTKDGAPIHVQPDHPNQGLDTDPRLACADFREWVTNLATPAQYNFIHCDFPYGINHNKHDGSAADKFGGYEDTPELYRSLLATFTTHLDRFCAPSAHIMFWFSMDYYHETFQALASAGLTVNPFPLIWYKIDNSGILPDPRRGPRRNYETAFLCSRGDRPVVQAVSNVAAVQNKVSEKIHTSQKPRAMLQHFFHMFVDKHSTVFDPTAGSASALRTAEAMGARSVFGLERDSKFHALALEEWGKEEKPHD